MHNHPIWLIRREVRTGGAAGNSYIGSNFNGRFIAGATATTFDGGSSSDDVVDYSAATAALALTLTYNSSVVQAPRAEPAASPTATASGTSIG